MILDEWNDRCGALPHGCTLEDVRCALNRKFKVDEDYPLDWVFDLGEEMRFHNKPFLDTFMWAKRMKFCQFWKREDSEEEYGDTAKQTQEAEAEEEKDEELSLQEFAMLWSLNPDMVLCLTHFGVINKRFSRAFKRQVPPCAYHPEFLQRKVPKDVVSKVQYLLCMIPTPLYKQLRDMGILTPAYQRLDGPEGLLTVREALGGFEPYPIDWARVHGDCLHYAYGVDD